MSVENLQGIHEQKQRAKQITAGFYGTKNQDVVLDKALTGLGPSLRSHFSIKRDVLTGKGDSA